MASLEHIDFKAWRDVQSNGSVSWAPEKNDFGLSCLPQIFWASGDGWSEANLWALDKVINQRCKIDTSESLMKHLHSYANFLELNQLDWRHFPVRLSERAVVRFRGYIVSMMESGELAASTARARMSAIIQFYRYAAYRELIHPATAMWTDRRVVVRFYDSHGFKRAITRLSSDLVIRNRSAPGTRLEDGLTPLSDTHMLQLLEYVSAKDSEELHLMLTIGFFTGARLRTLTTLTIHNLEQATADPYIHNMYLIKVGPGTGVATKFDVSGYLMIPEVILTELKRYAYSTPRLKRESKAIKAKKQLLFLTSRGNQYSNSTVGTLMSGLRSSSRLANLKFMEKFKFHQTRATYGTWLMKLALSVTTPAAALEFVKNAMLHKHESTTFTYIKFLETSQAKQNVAEAFNEVFTGLKNRTWNDFRV